MIHKIMANDSHRELANIIKNVHQTLRKDAKEIGEERAWSEHCRKTDVLKNYACAMQLLATEFWEKNANDDQNKRAISRVKWIVKKCEEYFYSGGMCDALSKEMSMCRRFSLQTDVITLNKETLVNAPVEIRVLDVGSCYNPFGKVPRFDVVAIDIAPVSGEVHLCDFLNLKVLEPHISPVNSDEQITELTAASFDVVIFSLLLEYLPSPKQRFICCSKASKLLVPGGILFIITPDSKHATANAQIIKKWKYALAYEGFLRIVYEKLPHLHCMVFRKCIHSDLSKQWVLSSLTSNMKNGKDFSDTPEQLMVIPQDFQTALEVKQETLSSNIRDNDESIASIFADLPDL